MPEFLPVCLRERLLANGRISLERDHDPLPVVQFFTPDAWATWLLTELDPDHPDIAFGLCALGLGAPDRGYGYGRASCRERGWWYEMSQGEPVTLKKHKN